MIFEVIVDISTNNTDRVFDYYGEDFFCIGQRVLVPFANRNVEGFIVGAKEETDVPNDKLKTILWALDDFVAISPEMLSLAEYMQQKYHLRKADVLRLFIPAQMRGNRVKEVLIRQVDLNADIPVETMLSSCKANAGKQKDLISFLAEHGVTPTAQLKDYGGAVKALIDKKYLVVSYSQKNRTPYKFLSGELTEHALTHYQQNAYDTITAKKGSYLLFGVTGSGKTEVYIKVIEKAISEGKTAILLVPEISLTPNVLKLFRTVFGEKVAILHSGLSVGERYDEWQRLKKGEATIAIGARSAVFAPLADLGVIIIDEQHDGSYRSESNPRYNTIDVAEFRANYNNCSLVMGTATPSLDSYYAAEQGKYTLITMPERINKQPLPLVQIVDMANEVRAGNREMFSTLLKQELDDCLQKGNQAMLFLNRRGYSSFVMCSKCGYVAKCEDCSVSLTFHQEDSALRCHYCGKAYNMFDRCPTCNSPYIRRGRVGTEQVVRYLEKLYPKVKVLRMDADTTSTKESSAKIITAFGNGEAQILVGTQMIAKGHDFPHVTLVGILEGDQSLYYSDYLANERTFQLITQVAGRSGRDKDVGKVVLQTFTPKHFCLLLAAKQDYVSFYEKEISLRKTAHFPPFAEVVRILYCCANSEKCVTVLNRHYAEIQKIQEKCPEAFIFLQRMRSPVKRKMGQYRYQTLMRLQKPYADEILKQIFTICDDTDKEVSVFCERDPQDLS